MFDISDENRRNNARNLAYTVMPNYKKLAPERLATVRGIDIEAILQQVMLVAETGAILIHIDPTRKISA